MNIGSIWHRWDLHYHTPSSYDYKNKAKTNEVLVQELLDDGVSGVAVTDHHVIDFGRINSFNKAYFFCHFRTLSFNVSLFCWRDGVCPIMA